MTLKLDPKGYFLIRINRKTSEIEVGFCTYKDKKVIKTWMNSDIEKLFEEIVSREEYISLETHKQYLKTEFARAKKSLKDNTEYVQD